MAHFYGWGSTASGLEPLRGGSLLFTTKFPEIPGIQFTFLLHYFCRTYFASGEITISCEIFHNFPCHVTELFQNMFFSG